MAERRPASRQAHEGRPVEIIPHFNSYAEGSVFIKTGGTHVLCTASVEKNVPPWMEGSGKGWVTAEYNMLPRSTHTRKKRERNKVSGRTHEIERLIGRALRAIIDREKLGERQIVIDCDVLQADGGTRTASITGGYIALALAIESLIKSGELKENPITDSIAAVSVGIKNNEVLVDLDYLEDSSCDVDMNFVVTGKGDFVEIQGTAEGQTFSREQMNAMTEGALSCLNELKKEQQKILN
ncbi:MAG: ribonuclease PH [Bdellovibrionaceae bacterium]|nr:ribonuclease PH [Pseudobdellovibrionaceae bacterium]